MPGENVTPVPGGAGSTRRPTPARNGVCLVLPRRHRLRRLADAGQPLDADRRGVAELDLDAEVALERVADDLALHLAVERHRQLAARLVLPQVDQRVFVGQRIERRAQRAPVAVVDRR